jgi:hypothetical protein
LGWLEGRAGPAVPWCGWGGCPRWGVHIKNYNVNHTEDRAGQDIARHQIAAYQPVKGAR